MTQTRPCRRMMRHFSHIFLALGRTFISDPYLSADVRTQPTPDGRRLRSDGGSRLAVSGVVSTLCGVNTVTPKGFRRAHQTGPEGPDGKGNAAPVGPQVREKSSASIVRDRLPQH